MAVEIKETNVLRVKLGNQYGDSKNINLPNPKTNLSLSQVRTAFGNLTSDTFLAGTEYLTAVSGASKIYNKTTPLE